ncbi:DUF6992 family protein [Hymenobacter siberiensis]|uniref:DUF6992 family protein n=1 Tax=Hymenobacter siberiensis TaxID=2848396 RepID=UPI001C1E7DD2|nr:hypothetical protein [Hymenobacter siberiensis]MBU6122020.1 hypothetical protein [Hymenobacter siberiensis]
MRSLFLLGCLLAVAPIVPAWAQVPADSLPRQLPASSTGLTAFAAERTRLDQRALAVLGGWAVGNLVVSGIATSQTEGSAHYFHQMNVGWGAVNLALAGTGYLAARRANRPPAADRATNVRAQLRTENLYLFNAGLDVAYLATGFYLLEKGRNPTASGSPERWRGYGQSLLLQGGFLLLFDGLQFAAHHQHGARALYPLLSRISIGPGAVALTWPLGVSGHRTVTPVISQ